MSKNNDCYFQAEMFKKQVYTFFIFSSLVNWLYWMTPESYTVGYKAEAV